MLLETNNLHVHFPIRRGVFSRTTGLIRAVDGVSLQLQAGETLGLVGESGCGKSTLARAILRLESITQGTVSFAGNDITNISGRKLAGVRKKLQVIFQDPFSALNPRMTIQEIVTEGPRHHRLPGSNDPRKLAQETLEKTGLGSEALDRYPHEFSGGQRQRICIARALAMKPDLIICDEAVSALDVSVQAQIINLLRDIQQEMHLAYLFIAHDISIVRHIAQRTAVMYLGRIIEEGDTNTVIDSPRHPYTQALMASIPHPGKERRPAPPLRGEVPSAAKIPPGCRFHPRCAYCLDKCKQTDPVLENVDKKNGQKAACIRRNELPLQSDSSAAES